MSGLWKELRLACNWMQGEGSLGHDERVQQVERARDEAIAGVYFLRQVLEEKKERNAIAF